MLTKIRGTDNIDVEYEDILMAVHQVDHLALEK